MLLFGATVVLAGCGSKSSSGCEDVPISLNNEVASSLATGFSVDDFQAVRAHDSKDLWFVSARATYPDGSVHYPVWGTKNLSGGPVYTIDNASQNVTAGLDKLQDAPSNDSAMADAQSCVQKGSSKGS